MFVFIVGRSKLAKTIEEEYDESKEDSSFKKIQKNCADKNKKYASPHYAHIVFLFYCVYLFVFGQIEGTERL